MCLLMVQCGLKERRYEKMIMAVRAMLLDAALRRLTGRQGPSGSTLSWSSNHMASIGTLKYLSIRDKDGESSIVLHNLLQTWQLCDRLATLSIDEVV